MRAHTRTHLIFKIGLGEFQGVQESLGGSQTYTVTTETFTGMTQ